MVLFCALAVTACKKSSSGGNGTGGSSSNAKTDGGGTTSAAGSSGGGSNKVCINQDMDNADCTMVLKNEPTSGDCAPKGACCHRASNIAKEKTLGPNDSMNIDYVLHYNNTTNHPKTISTGLPLASNLAIYANESQDVLWRLTVPRMDGKEISGAGEATFGYGVYNCKDGTYSFFSDTAAPKVAGLSDDPARWAAKKIKTMVDVSKTNTDRFKMAFADEMSRRQFISLPYVATAKPDYPLDWELSFMGFHLIDFKTEDANRDCAGTVGGGANGWTAGIHYEVYTPVFGNNKSIITDLGVTYCTLVSFGIGAAKGLDCETEPRCMPGKLKDGSGTDCKVDTTKYPDGKGDPCCPWAKLPDSLCPATADEQGIYNCHPGAKGNPNAEMGYPSDTDLKCTMTAPTMALDPDKGATDNGQCCDPLGKKTDGLPDCNSYRLLEEAVAAAATITAKPSDKTQANCAMMP
jgi:hypothetical protein